MSETNNQQDLPKRTGRRHIVEWVVLILIVIVLSMIVLLSIDARKKESERVDNSTSKVQGEASQEASDDGSQPELPPVHTEYAGLDENTVFTRSSEEDIISTVREGTGVVFLGFPACPWCQGFAPIANEAAKNAGLKEIKYLDIRESRQQGSEAYLTLVDLLRDYLPVGDDGQPHITVPDMTVLRDGEVLFRYEAEDAPQGENTPATYWTEDRTIRVRQQLEAEFQALKLQ